VQNEILRGAGYFIRELVVNPLQLGIPNSRLRYYMLARTSAPFEPKADEEEEEEEEKKVWRCIPNEPHMEAFKEEDGREIREYLDSALTDDEEEEYSVPDKILGKWGRLFDIVLPSSKRTCCFTRGYTHLVERSGSILQVEEELDVSARFLPSCLF
jgi:tRNA (cytosine38-C5)-methyltransferase